MPYLCTSCTTIFADPTRPRQAIPNYPGDGGRSDFSRLGYPRVTWLAHPLKLTHYLDCWVVDLSRAASTVFPPDNNLEHQGDGRRDH